MANFEYRRDAIEHAVGKQHVQPPLGAGGGQLHTTAYTLRGCENWRCLTRVWNIPQGERQLNDELPPCISSSILF